MTASTSATGSDLPGFEEGLLLALTVDVESSKPILDEKQRMAIQKVATARLDANPEDVSARLALVQSLRT